MLMSLGGPECFNVISGWNSLCVCMCIRVNGLVCVRVCLSLSAEAKEEICLGKILHQFSAEGQRWLWLHLSDY